MVLGRFFEDVLVLGEEMRFFLEVTYVSVGFFGIRGCSGLVLFFIFVYYRIVCGVRFFVYFFFRVSFRFSFRLRGIVGVFYSLFCVFGWEFLFVFNI